MFHGKRIVVPTLLAKIAVGFCSILPMHCVSWIAHIPVIKKNVYDAV